MVIVTRKMEVTRSPVALMPYIVTEFTMKTGEMKDADPLSGGRRRSEGVSGRSGTVNNS